MDVVSQGVYGEKPAWVRVLVVRRLLKRMSVWRPLSMRKVGPGRRAGTAWVQRAWIEVK